MERGDGDGGQAQQGGRGDDDGHHHGVGDDHADGDHDDRFIIITIETQEGLHTYTLGENEFSDLTFQEFLDTMTGYK